MNRALRLEQAAEMVNVANSARESGNFVAALMLYIPALEMVGWEINEQFDLLGLIQSAVNDRSKNHRVRQFSAISVMFWHGYRFTNEDALKPIDFSRLHFKRIARAGGGPDDYDLKAEDVDNEVMSFLTKSLSIGFKVHGVPEAARESVERIRSTMYAVGYAACGFIDNKRMALLHEDNKFDFTTANIDGTVATGPLFDLEAECNWHAHAANEIWSGLDDNVTTSRVKEHLPHMIKAFQTPLRAKSYVVMR